tara:strand:- start:530 stop:679 length:150 start_codon:yes stop_codon:yes gene_type:complete
MDGSLDHTVRLIDGEENSGAFSLGVRFKSISSKVKGDVVDVWQFQRDVV